ncbi:hypothetical protein GWI33_007240 [Rhynchophorus ferrugineus]|uniref:Uncharacterized protein n=1 Tax=Rhynchophorus ferrugineus TaxID=354439 RepID=A0A834IAA4_RHYFE|nr:hypothetical protein GWI33_007240 [Rhynchophorus ferrugineus]
MPENSSAARAAGVIVSAEEGTAIKIQVRFSAAGHYMPQCPFFPIKRTNQELMLNAPTGAWGMCSDFVWMTTERFLCDT